jgi:hypothetical protein
MPTTTQPPSNIPGPGTEGTPTPTPPPAAPPGLTLPFKGSISSWPSAGFEIDNTATLTGTATGDPVGTAVLGSGAIGVWGNGASATGAGVRGLNTQGAGVEGTSTSGVGVYGQTSGSGAATTGASGNKVAGVSGQNLSSGYGVFGSSASGDGVHGESASPNDSGVCGHNSAPKAVALGAAPKGYGVSGTSDQNIGVYGSGGQFAGWFDGNVVINGQITHKGNYTCSGTMTAQDVMLTAADCAEEFDIVADDEVDPGTVMVFDETASLRISNVAYDTKVAGVISGGGDYRPGLILDKGNSEQKRMPVALMGKVYCKVDAEYGPIEVGDLLTTSPTPGHAMRATDPLKAFGSVIGKAMRTLKCGRGLIPVLIALQ